MQYWRMTLYPDLRRDETKIEEKFHLCFTLSLNVGGRNSAAKIGKKTIKPLALTKRSWLTCDNLFILNQSNQKAAKRTCAPGPAHSQLKTRFCLKMHDMFSVHTTPERWENATNTDYCGFGLEEDSSKEITLSWRHRFRKALFFVISVDSRPNCEINAAFSHFSHAVLKGPWFIVSCTLERFQQNADS